MVQLLLLFIRATRTSVWQLHLSTLRSMIRGFLPLIELTTLDMDPVIAGWKCLYSNEHIPVSCYMISCEIYNSAILLFKYHYCYLSNIVLSSSY